MCDFMKKLIFSFVVGLLLTACGGSPLDKAEALIKKELPNNLIKPESYDPIETRIDSAFTPLDDPMLYSEIEKFAKLAGQADKIRFELEMLQNDMKMAKSKMAIHSDNIRSAYSRNEFNEAKSTFREGEKKEEYYIKSMKAIAEQCRGMLKKLDKMMNAKHEFIGYRATHKYRSANNDGNVIISEECYILDKNMKEILFNMPLEEYKSIQDSADMLRDQLGLALQTLEAALGE